MDFTEIAKRRYSCRKYDPERQIEKEKLEAILEAARLSPSACNGQPYHITVCKGETAKKVAEAVGGMGMNEFAVDAPVMLVISEEAYAPLAALGAKLKKNDYRSIDIGIVSAYITAEAAAQEIESCILGWLDGDKLKSLCGVSGTVRLVITLGYSKNVYEERPKKRKDISELVSTLE